ncbi:tetratricopeptide repeat protein [Poseidonibacter sp.]|uniref:tetratricopeptide repeat protein n=1 Tax=Poseidonibacter sp. TaxID=2321188 RepID=UPI003C77FA59
MAKELNFEQLQKKLKKVLDTNKFRFIFIFYPDINLREDIKNYISENFAHSNSITLELENNTYQNISNKLYENDKSFIFIDDFFDILENADLYNGFNQRRDKIASKNINLICFVNSFSKETFFKTAIEVIPDLLEFKNAIFEIEQIDKENKLEIKEIHSRSYSSLGGLTTESKRKEIKRLLLKLEDVKNNEQKNNLLNQLSTIYKDMGELKKALEYQEKSLKLTEEILGDKHPDLASNYSNISMIYKDLKECKKVKEYIEKAINIWKDTGYHKKELFNARNILKDVDFHIKKEKKAKGNKKGKICKDI